MKRIHGRTRWGRLAAIFGAAAVTALQCRHSRPLPDSNFPGRTYHQSPCHSPQHAAKKRTNCTIRSSAETSTSRTLDARRPACVRKCGNNGCFGGCAEYQWGPVKLFGGGRLRQPTGGNKGNDFFVQQWMRLGSVRFVALT